MSQVKGGVYQRGPFWLDYVRGADGEPASTRFYIWWYDAVAGRLQRRSTRQSDVRLACDALDAHYLATHRSTEAEQAAYGVADAMADYWIEHGQHLPSAAAIKSRFAQFNQFREMEQAAGRMPSPLLPDHLDDRLLDRFRAWAITVPIVARKKDDAGNWIDGKSRPRAASTVEETVIQLKAALNFAFKARRTRYVPPLQHKTRAQVTSARTFRLSLETLGEMLDYTFRGAGNYTGHADRLLPMRRYLIAGICTLARPDAIFDMSVKAEREQWMQNERRFALNPSGRIQTKKVRPIVPVVDVLHSWLSATDEWFVCKERKRFDEKQQVDVIEQIGVGAVRSAWDGMREQFSIPEGFGPKLVRHSMSTILANRKVDLVELEIAMGHRAIKKTTSHYVIFDPDYLSSIRDGIEDVVSDLTRMAGPALHAKLTQGAENVAVLRA